MQRRLIQLALIGVLTGVAVALCADTLGAHGMARRDVLFVQSINGPAVGPFLYLGAKHMVTGYDHLMFLVGVIFFLYRLKDVVQYVSLFTIGHSITLLAGVLGGIHANPYLIDAIIGLSVVYKAFENMGGFDRLLGFRPNTRIAVMTFGLFHGFGLATKLQEFTMSRERLKRSERAKREIRCIRGASAQPSKSRVRRFANEEPRRRALVVNTGGRVYWHK